MKEMEEQPDGIRENNLETKNDITTTFILGAPLLKNTFRYNVPPL